MKLKQIVFTIILLNITFAFSIFASDADSIVRNRNGIDINREEMPKFPGGDEKLLNFIQSNLKYPKEAQKKGIEGKVIIRFVVSKDGNIINIESIKEINILLEQEAIRVVKLMPKWKPGMIDGNPVDVYYTLPITFKLNR